MRRLSPVLFLVAATLALAAAGCGGDGSEEESATPAEAVSEIREIKTMLAAAVGQVRSGDADAAEETVGDAYLEHFEKVEGPLGERDHDLMEELEEAISTDLRREIKAGKAVDEIESAVDEIEDDLERAVRRGAGTDRGGAGADRRGRDGRRGRRSRTCVRARPHRVPRPLRAGGGAAPAPRPEPRPRRRVQLRRVPERNP